MDPVLYEVRESDRVAVITLNRPKQHNAQSLEMLDLLDEYFDRAANDARVRVILLQANGKNFSSGHDLASNAENRPKYDLKNRGVELYMRNEEIRYLGYCQKWRDIPKPTIAAVQGACIAGGLMLCWPCDLIIAAENATFRDPVVFMGIGGVEYHAHTWEFGARKAKELLFTGDAISADEAEKYGMVNHVVPEDSLHQYSLDLAMRIAENESFGLMQAKRNVNATLDIMGQRQAIEAAFMVQTLGHANALAIAGKPSLGSLEQMKAKLKRSNESKLKPRD